jgi:peroxiredoxin
MEDPSPRRPAGLSGLILAASLLAIVIGLLLIIRPSITTPAASAPTDIALPKTAGLIGPAVQTIKEGDQAPDFELATLDGRIIKLSNLRGQPVLVNFWATWCVPCKQEMPSIVDAYNAHKAGGLRVLAIDTTAFDDLQDVRKFVTNYQMNFDVLLDDTDSVGTGWNTLGLPSSYFIKPDGTVAKVHVGAMTADQLDQYLKLIMPNS